MAGPALRTHEPYPEYALPSHLSIPCQNHTSNATVPNDNPYYIRGMGQLPTMCPSPYHWVAAALMEVYKYRNPSHANGAGYSCVQSQQSHL